MDMKFVKIAVIVAGIVLAVALVAPMALKGTITAEIRREADAALRAQLDFETLNISLLRCFPHASVELKNLTLIGQERFAGDTIMTARRISMIVDLLPLLNSRELVVSKVIFTSPTLHAHKLADGAVNWDIRKSVGTPHSTASAALDVGDDVPCRFAIHDIRVSQASIYYQDDSTKSCFSACSASLRLRGDLAAEQTELDLCCAAEKVNFVSGGIPLLWEAEAAIEAVVDADLTHQHFAFSDNTLRLNAIEVALAGWVETQGNALTMNLKASCDKVQFKDVLSLVPAFYMRDFRSLAASGELSMALWARGKMQGRQLPAFELKTEVNNGSFQYSSLPKAVTNIQIAARIFNPGGVMDQTEIDLSEFSLQMAGNPLSVTLHASNLISDPSFRAAVVGRVDLGTVKKVYPLQEGVELAGVISTDMRLSGRMSDIDSLHYDQTEASGMFVVEGLDLRLPALPALRIRRAAVTVTPQTMTVGECGLTLGHSDLSVNGQLSGYLNYLLRGGMLSGRLYVKSDVLDINEIMAAARSEESAVQSATAAAAPSAVNASPLVVPRNLDLSLKAEMHQVYLGKMHIASLAGEMHAAQGVLTFDRVGMQLFGAQAAASGYYSTAVDSLPPSLQLTLGIDRAPFVRTYDEWEMIQRLAPIFAKTSGDYSLVLDMSTMLDAALSPDLSTLHAEGRLDAGNVRILPIGAFDALAKTIGEDGMRGAEAKELSIRFSIHEGCIVTQPFVVMMGGFDIALSGATNLNRTIDYTARVSLPGGVLGGLLESIPVHIGGSFADPKISLGAREVTGEAVKEAIDRQIETLTAKPK